MACVVKLFTWIWQGQVQWRREGKGLIYSLSKLSWDEFYGGVYQKKKKLSTRRNEHCELTMYVSALCSCQLGLWELYAGRPSIAVESRRYMLSALLATRRWMTRSGTYSGEFGQNSTLKSWRHQSKRLAGLGLSLVKNFFPLCLLTWWCKPGWIQDKVSYGTSIED